MHDHVYRIIEIAGSSEKSIEDAIQTAVARASSATVPVVWTASGENKLRLVSRLKVSPFPESNSYGVVAVVL